MNHELPGIDLITLLYNAEKFIDDYFLAITQINYPKDKLRINLLDNSPDDNNLYNYIQEKYLNNPEIPFQINLEKSPQNLGFSGGNNYYFEKLLQTSDLPFFFLLNQDSKINPECLHFLGIKIQEHPDTGMLEAIQSPKEHPKYYDPETFETSWCSGGGVLIRKEALRETGFFDHKFFLYCEDVDLSWRMWKEGWKCRVCPEAKYEHFTEELDAEKDQSIRYFYSFRNGFLMHLKHDSLPGILKYYPLAFAVCFKQDPIRRKAFLKACFAAQKYLPYYLWQKLTEQKKPKPDWIYFNGFEFGKRRKFEDRGEERVFL